MGRLVVGSVSVVLVLGACTSLDGLITSDPATPDASVPDATNGDTDGSMTSTLDAGSNDGASIDGKVTLDGATFVINSGFEGTCGPLEAPPSTTSTEVSSEFHSGNTSCRVCGIGTENQFYGLVENFPTGTWGPGKYTLDAYALAEKDAGSTVIVSQLTVKSTNGALPRYPGQNSTANPSGWIHLHVVADIAMDEYLSGVSIGGNSSIVGQCVFIDDLSLVRE